MSLKEFFMYATGLSLYDDMVAENAYDNERRRQTFELKYAAAEGKTEQVRALLAQGFDIHAADDVALRGAAFHGRTETVELLIASGAYVSAKGRDGKTALELARLEGYMETANALEVAIKERGLRQMSSQPSRQR